MHGYLRMYWAKKILEWTRVARGGGARSPCTSTTATSSTAATPTATPASLWAIGGLHDRPWFERPVFGKVRYMSFDGSRRKFDVDAYVRKVAAPPRPATAAGAAASHRRRKERA